MLAPGLLEQRLGVRLMVHENLPCWLSRYWLDKIAMLVIVFALGTGSVVAASPAAPLGVAVDAQLAAVDDDNSNDPLETVNRAIFGFNEVMWIMFWGRLPKLIMSMCRRRCAPVSVIFYRIFQVR